MADVFEYGLPPFIPEGAQILLLGSMPSVKSLEEGFFYAHPRNRLWPIVSCKVGRELHTLEDKKAAAAELKLGLYDVIQGCRRQGSLDRSIKDPVPADIPGLLSRYTSIKRIILNGGLAKTFFYRHFAAVKTEVIALPSTSPANAQYKFDQLYELYARALDV